MREHQTSRPTLSAERLAVIYAVAFWRSLNVLGRRILLHSSFFAALLTAVLCALLHVSFVLLFLHSFQLHNFSALGFLACVLRGFGFPTADRALLFLPYQIQQQQPRGFLHHYRHWIPHQPCQVAP